MSRTAVLAVAALVVALFALLTSFFAVAAPDTPTRERLVAEAAGRTAVTEGELLERMIQFQRYAEKTHLAAEADNWELAAFYAHEVEENAERVVDGGHVEDGVDISAIAAEVALPRAEALHAAAEAGDGDAFRAAYARMIDGCNTCHKRSGHRFIQIVVPGGAEAYPSQDFAPLSGERPGRTSGPAG